MGNYYRSRLAEELAIYYAKQVGLEITADSGGLSRIPNPNHPGTISKATIQYLQNKKVVPINAGRFPKNCISEEVYNSDIVVCTDEEEQRDLFKQNFPDYKGKLICWNARDIQYDTIINTTERIDKLVQELIANLIKV